MLGFLRSGGRKDLPLPYYLCKLWDYFNIYFYDVVFVSYHLSCVFLLFQARYTADREFFEVEIFRGLSKDGSVNVGPATGMASVKYSIFPMTAKVGIDFSGNNGTTNFTSGQRASRLALPIFTPSNQTKTFQISISAISGSSFLTVPSSAFVVIAASRGMIGWQIANMTPVVDSGRPAILKLQRIDGVYGRVVVTWLLLLSNATGSENVTGLDKTTGNVVIADGASSALVSLTVSESVEEYPLPRPVQNCRLTLVSVTGAGVAGLDVSAGNMLTPVLPVVIADAGDAYGVVYLVKENISLVVVSMALNHNTWHFKGQLAQNFSLLLVYITLCAYYQF